MRQVGGMSWDQIDSEMISQLRMFDHHHKRIQDLMMNDMKPPYIYSGLSGYQDFFANITIRGTYIENNHTKYHFSPWLTGHIFNFFEAKGLNYLLNNAVKIAPIESMFFLGDNPRKCFTFFSHLQRYFRKMKAHLTRVRLEIPFLGTWFPYGEHYQMSFSIHSANIIPQANTFSKINGIGNFLIVYSTVKNQENLTSLTCSDYDMEYKHGNFNMKSDCLFQCLRKKLSSNCDLYIMEKLSHIPFRQTLFPDKIPTEKCQFQDKDYFIKEEECSRICLNECHQEYYFQETKELGRDKRGLRMGLKDRKIVFYFEPSSLPTVIVTHLPEMTFMTLFCNFAGLLGMWLGVSMFTTMNNFCILLKHLLAKLHIINNFNNNLLLIENKQLNYYNVNHNYSHHLNRHSISRRRLSRL